MAGSRLIARKRCGVPTAFATRPWTTGRCGSSRPLITAIACAPASMSQKLEAASLPSSRSLWGLRGEFGSVAADAGRRLSLRMDRGSQCTSDDFREQIRFSGIAPNYAFVVKQQTNGVAERFNQTMKEQTIHGRVFKNLEEVRAAAVAFNERYNRDWRLEKLGFKCPPRSPSGTADEAGCLNEFSFCTGSGCLSKGGGWGLRKCRSAGLVRPARIGDSTD